MALRRTSITLLPWSLANADESGYPFFRNDWRMVRLCFSIPWIHDLAGSQLVLTRSTTSYLQARSFPMLPLCSLRWTRLRALSSQSHSPLLFYQRRRFWGCNLLCRPPRKRRSTGNCARLKRKSLPRGFCAHQSAHHGPMPTRQHQHPESRNDLAQARSIPVRLPRLSAIAHQQLQ